LIQLTGPIRVSQALKWLLPPKLFGHWIGWPKAGFAGKAQGGEFARHEFSR